MKPVQFCFGQKIGFIRDKLVHSALEEPSPGPQVTPEMIDDATATEPREGGAGGSVGAVTTGA